MNKKTIIIGVRGSKLAIKYAELAIKEIKKFYSGKINLKKIVTRGDKILNRRTSDIGGKGEFIKNIEKELISKKIDIAVHSLKDIPYKETPGLVINTFLKRNSPKEVLVSKNNLTLKKLKKNSVIGTSSYRREFQLRSIRPDLKFKLIRGNIDSRIKKIFEKKYDAIILAKAGLKCLKMLKFVAQEFNCTKIIPSAGQGIITLQSRRNDIKINKLLEKINHKHTAIRAIAERRVLKILKGDCSTAVGVYSFIKKRKLFLKAELFSIDGKNRFYREYSAGLDKALKIGNIVGKYLEKKSNVKYKI
tara:strand:+ start:1165 stop:2076 length:912 start_codon:yes stop_codon:yes gene_type:complete